MQSERLLLEELPVVRLEDLQEKLPQTGMGSSQTTKSTRRR